MITKHEKLIMLTRPHWIYLVKAIFWLGLLSAAGYWVQYYFVNYASYTAKDLKVELIIVEFNPTFKHALWLFFGTGLAVFIPLCLVYLTNEIGLTNERIIYKRGLLFIQIDQYDLEDIRSEDVSHGIFGWLLGYGNVHLDCRFVDDIYLPAIPHPYKFLKAAHVARMKNSKINYGQDDLSSNLQKLEELQLRKKQKMRALSKAVIRRFQNASEKN